MVESDERTKKCMWNKEWRDWKEREAFRMLKGKTRSGSGRRDGCSGDKKEMLKGQEYTSRRRGG